MDPHHHHNMAPPHPAGPNHSLSSSPNPDQPGSLSSTTTTGSSAMSSPTSTITMNASHYQMLVTGHIHALADAVSEENLQLFDIATEFDNSSVLHIAAMAGQVDLIEFLVSHFNNHHHHHILLRPNSRGDLPIHVAARAGKTRAAEKLVQKCTDLSLCCGMLEAENEDGDTPLHVALENQQEAMAMLLFGKCPHVFYRLNKQGLCPLYLAIKAGFRLLVERMVRVEVEDESIVKERLEKGGIVHAAIMAKDLGTLRIMLDEYRDLVRACDEKGRTPLSYAAYIGFHEGVKYLLKSKTSSSTSRSTLKFINIEYRPDNDGTFPIHSACSGGNIKVVKLLLEHSRDMMWLLNKKQQNILHVAAESGKAMVVNHILGLPDSGSLINMKDEDGNTPLHLAAQGKHPRVVYALTWDGRVRLNLQNKQLLTALDIAEVYGQVPSFQERLTWLALRYAGVPRSPTYHHTMLTISNHPLTEESESSHGIFTAQAISTNHVVCPLQSSELSPTNKYKERLNTLLMVSTLVATVTYASGFAVPGGYRQDNEKNHHNIGMAVLAKRAAFKVFVISDTVALFCSILAVVTLVWAHLDDLRLILLALDFAIPLLGVSLVMMCVAFMAGLYVTLQHMQVWLGILVLVMGSALLGAVLVFFVPLYSPTSRIRFRVLRYVFHVPFTLMLLACEKGESQTLY